MKRVLVLLFTTVVLSACQSTPPSDKTANSVASGSSGSLSQFSGRWVGTVGNAITSHRATFQINVDGNHVSGYYQQNNESQDAISNARMEGGALKMSTGPIGWTLRKSGANGLSGSWQNMFLSGPVNVSRVGNGSTPGSAGGGTYGVSGKCRAQEVEAEAERLRLRSSGMGICQMSLAYEKILKKAAAAYKACGETNNARQMELAARDARATARASCVAGTVN